MAEEYETRDCINHSVLTETSVTSTSGFCTGLSNIPGNFPGNLAIPS